MIRVLPMLVALLLAGPAAAQEPFADPQQEARAQDIGRQLRCVVCANQSVADSNAPLAADILDVVRERIAAGDDDAAVIDYVAARYGDFVRLRPPFQTNTLFLWLAPVAALVLGAGLAAVVLAQGRRGRRQAAPLTAEEQARIDAMLDECDPPAGGDGSVDRSGDCR